MGDHPAGSPPAPTGTSPVANAAATAVAKVIVTVLKFVIKVIALLVAILTIPFIVLGALMHFLWPWYSSVPLERNLDNALIAVASVAGVLWSGAIIAYSIHRKYTPPLRTGVQLLHFAILAPLVGLIAQGPALRTAFYFAMLFYAVEAFLGLTDRKMLKPGMFPTLTAKPQETPQQVKLREELAASEATQRELFKRIAHGTGYFAFVALLCLAIFVLGEQAAIAWSCIAVLVVSLFLMLPEIFNVSDMGQQDPKS